MKIREMTIGQTTGVLWAYLWRGLIWIVLTELAAYALGIPWSMRVLGLCLASAFVDAMLRPYAEGK